MLALPLATCAKVSVNALSYDGTPLASAVEGVRYYDAHPYLIVAQLPVDPPATAPKSADDANQRGATSHSNKETSNQERAGKPTTTTTTGNKTAPTPADAPATAPGGGTSDTGFAASTRQYSIKLIYLPDYSRPYAISESPGLFGTTSMKPQLQNGWMLVSLDAAGDSKVSETLAAIASLIPAAFGVGAGPKPASTPSGTPSPNRNLGVGEGVPDNILPPGLYKLEYNKFGNLVGLRRVTGFCSDTGEYSRDELAKVLNAELSPSATSLLDDKCTTPTVIPSR